MPTLRDLEIVRRLNAPTRAAATRRRRLRKAGAAGLLGLAALIGFGGAGGSGAASGQARSADHSARQGQADLRGRQLVAVPVDASLAGLLGRARVDVWAKNGTRLAESAPTAAPGTPTGGSSLTGGSSNSPRALVALTPASVASIAAHLNRTGGTWDDLFLTVAA